MAMEAVIMENEKVEIRSRSGEVLVIDRGDYELAQGLLKLAKETSPRILRAAAKFWENDPDRKTESAFLAKVTFMYLEHIQA
jgi:hypothetical protein